jgi:hypothetical protein
MGIKRGRDVGNECPTLAAVLVLSSKTEDVVVALLSVQTFPLCVVGHA